MRYQLSEQVARRAEYRMICQHLWAHELMAALDENARLLKNGDYNMLVCHMILHLLRENEIRRGLVHGIEVEFLRFEASALDRARLADPKLDAALKQFQSAFLDEVILQDSDCSLM